MFLRFLRLTPLVLMLHFGLGWAEDGYIADKNGCKIANPSPKPLETVTWSGSCKDGYAEGQGTMQWYDDNQPGALYQGTLVHGALSGKGKLTLPNGATYEGGWLDGKQSGTGVLTAIDGGDYRGEWKNGEPDGAGVMRSGTGETVTGIWKEGIYIGPGKDK
jgi:hypothetical protein